MSLAIRSLLPLLVATLAVACLSYEEVERAMEEAVRTSDLPETTAEETTNLPGSAKPTDPSTPPDTDEPTGPGETTETEPTDSADAGLPEFGLASCEDIEPLEPELRYPGCEHVVEHPRFMRRILPSCGDSSAGAEPRFVSIAFATEKSWQDVTFNWMVSGENRSGMVELGTSAENLDQRHYAYSFAYRALDTDPDGQRYVHEVHVCGLEPATTYWYRVGSEGYWSDVYSFTTGLEPDSRDEYTFAVTGDTRNPTNEPWAQAMEQIAGFAPDFHLFSGDAVESGPVQSQWDSWFSAGEPWMAEQFFLPANGNHDVMAVNYVAMFALPGDEENYWFRYGNGVFIMLNDFPVSDPTAIRGSTRDFLDRVLRENADATWKVVVHHRPIYSASTRHGSTMVLREEWQPIYDRHGVDLVFNGHDHNYERSVPIREDREVAMGDGTVYVVAAGIGAPLYQNGSEWWTVTSERTENFVIVNVRDQTLEMTAYRLDGTVIDRYTITK